MICQLTTWITSIQEKYCSTSIKKQAKKNIKQPWTYWCTSYHGKSVVIDHELSAIGSYNFDLRSTYLDTELMLVIQSKDLTAELETYMASYEQDVYKRQVLCHAGLLGAHSLPGVFNAPCDHRLGLV